VRIISRAPSRDSILLTAFDTVAFEKPQLRGGGGKGATLGNFREDGEPFKVRQSDHDAKFSKTSGFDSLYF